MDRLRLFYQNLGRSVIVDFCSETHTYIQTHGKNATNFIINNYKIKESEGQNQRILGRGSSLS